MKVYDQIEQMIYKKGLISQSRDHEYFRKLAAQDNKIHNIQTHLISIKDRIKCINNPFYLLQQNLNLILDQFNLINNMNIVNDWMFNSKRKTNKQEVEVIQTKIIELMDTILTVISNTYKKQQKEENNYRNNLIIVQKVVKRLLNKRNFLENIAKVVKSKTTM